MFNIIPFYLSTLLPARAIDEAFSFIFVAVAEGSVADFLPWCDCSAQWTSAAAF